MLPGDADDPQTIGNAALKIDRRGFLEVFGRAGYFCDRKAMVDNLGQHFVVKDKII